MNGTTAYALSKQYVASTADSLGSLKGAPCTIKSQTETDDSYIITFEWTGTSGTKETSRLTIKKPKDGKDGIYGTNGKDGSDGVGITKIEKIGTVDLVDTYRITFTDNSTFDYEVTNGKDGTGGEGASKWSEISDKPFETLSTDFAVEDGELKVIGGTGSGEENTIESISVNGVNVAPDENKNVDITVPDAYDDTALSNRVKIIEDDYAKSSDIPSLSGYATETWVNEQGFLTHHQDLSNYAKKNEIPDVSGYITEEQLLAKDYADKAYVTEEVAKISTGGEIDLTPYLKKTEASETYVAKEGGKSLIADTEIARLASVNNYDDTYIRAEIDNKADITDIPSLEDYVENTVYKSGEYVVSDKMVYKVLNDYTSHTISDDIKDGNIKQYIGNNASGLANIIEISDVLNNTKIGGDETIASSILASDINDLQLNQLVYDTNGIIATINSIDTSANTVKLRIIHSNPDTQEVIPEPSSDDKLYFRSREVGATDGKWVEFTTVDGKTLELTINKKASSTEGSYVPKAQELVYDTDNNYIVIGDGSTSLGGLKAFYSTTVTKSDIITALGYTPEDILQKGQANGYAPLDANGLVPVGNLPANVVSSYSKAEIDNKDASTLTSATTLINSEASTARANEEAIKKDLETHVNNTAIHVTQTDKDNWNKKVEQTDLANYDTHIADTSIHVTQADKDKWDGMNKCYFVDNVSDLPITNNDIGNMGYVKTSSAGITPIACATYIWDGSAWQEIDQTQVSLMFEWDNIQNRPTSTVLQIDDSVTKTHEHTNKIILDKISQSASGNFMYDGNEIGIKVEFLDTDKDLPNVGDDDTLYVVYVDSRVRNFPSISVYRDGAFYILGRGTQDMPQQVGDMVILQNEYFSAKANASFIITVTSNQFFSFMPVEILKKVSGATAQEKVLVNTDDSSNFKFDDTVVDINNGIKLNIDSIPLKLDSVSDRYLLYEDVDLSKYKNISSIG